MLTPVQSQRYAQFVNNFTEKEFYAYHDHLLEGGTVEDFFEKMEKHGTHDQKTHGNWANSWATGARTTPDDKWLIDNFGDKTTFTRNDPNGLLRFSIPNSLIDDPRYQETIQISLDTLDKLQEEYPLTTQVDFVKGNKLENGFLGETFSASVDGVPAPSKIILTEGLLKPNAETGLLVHTITHEWGHAQDWRTPEKAKTQGAKFSQAQFEDGYIPMTDYGYTNNREAYAEAFAIKFNGAHKGGVWSQNVIQTDKWEEVFKIFELDTINKAKGERVSFLVKDTFDPKNPPILIENYIPPVLKHGTHDQKTHGSWATNGNSYDEIDAQNEVINAEWRKKYRELDNYLTSKGMTHSWKQIEADPKAKKMRAEVDAIDAKRQANTNKFYEEHFEKNETEDFARLRTKYVVADTPTLKMNQQLREGGGLTQRVKDADALCAMGVVKERVGVYRGAILPQTMVDSLKVGTSFVDKGFQSTDVLKSSAKFYAEVRKDDGAKGTNVLFRMTLNKGLNAVDVGYGEIAVQRNATMTVTNKSKSGDFTIIDVEVTK